MKEIVTICFSILLLALNLSLLVVTRRSIRTGSKMEGAIATLFFCILGALAVFIGGLGSEGLYQTMQKTAAFSYLKKNFLSSANPQLLYFLLYLLGINLVSVIAGSILWLGVKQICKIFSKKMTKLSVTGAFFSVLGKWLWNLSNAFVVLFLLQSILGIVSVYLELPSLGEFYSYEGKLAWLHGFFRLPCLLSVIMASASATFRYDAKRSLVVDSLAENGAEESKLKENMEKNSLSHKHLKKRSKESAAYKALLQGDSMRVKKEDTLSDFLPDYLYECFRNRRRVLVLCRENEKSVWHENCNQMLTGRFGEICLMRIGDITNIKNREDIDLLIADRESFYYENLQQIWPFWFSQIGFIIIADTDWFLSNTKQADWFFSLWPHFAKEKQPLIQYLFLDCTMTDQEKEALDYYVGNSVVDNKNLDSNGNDPKDDQKENEPSFDKSSVLVPWMLVSPAGIYRRLLLSMQSSNGIPESALIKQKKRFGMKMESTEEFLSKVLSTVLPDYPVQNSYEAFLFREEITWPHSKWRVRLSDAVYERLLQTTKLSQNAAIYQTEKTQRPDLVYELEGMSSLSSTIYQENKTLKLYQTQATCTCNGIYVIPDQTLDAYKKILYKQYEKKEINQHTDVHEAVCLKLTIKANESAEKKILEQLLCAICNEVLETVFPYNIGQITACYQIEAERDKKGMVPKMIEQEKTNSDSVTSDSAMLTIYLIENQSEQGLVTAIYQNSSLFLNLCKEWLDRAITDPSSKEAALVEYLMSEQSDQLMLPAASTSAGQLAGLAKLLKGILGEKS